MTEVVFDPNPLMSMAAALERISGLKLGSIGTRHRHWIVRHE